jgi:predicted enzyme related to lactoylglutathione lyase
MTPAFVVTLDVNDIELMSEFWSNVLHYRASGDFDGVYLTLRAPKGGRGVSLTLQKVDDPRTTKSRLHIDVLTTTLDDEALRIEALGAIRGDIFDEYGETWIAFTDPEGNEFCLIEDTGQRV